MGNVLGALAKLSKTIVKFTPQIATGLGVFLMIGAVVEAVDATVDAVEVDKENVKQIKEGKIEKPKHMFLFRVKTLWKFYFMTAVLLIFGVASVLFGAKVQAVRTATVTAVCEAERAMFEQYREHTKEVVGAEKEQEIHENAIETAKSTAPELQTGSAQLMIYPDEECMFKDSITGQFFKSTWSDVRDGFVNLNFKLLSEDRVSILDYADQFGIDSKDEEHGWDINNGKMVLAEPQAIFSTRGAYILIGPDREPKDIKSWHY